MSEIKLDIEFGLVSQILTTAIKEDRPLTPNEQSELVLRGLTILYQFCDGIKTIAERQEVMSMNDSVRLDRELGR